MLTDTVLFFGLWLRKPLQIAAVCPSGTAIAAAMARLADPGRPGLLLELGAGTGSLTRGLVESGWPPGRIVAVLRPCFKRLGSGGRFLQLTNAFSSPWPIEQLGLDGHEAARVWRNLPPAQIWAYTAGSGGPARRMP
jgi:phospholipid N-methyltransferase